jgi:hypothetical protein
MRVIFGMILGAALTIGVAYVHDTWMVGPVPVSAKDKPMVNWDSVNENVRVVAERARAEWDKLTR